MKHLVYLVLQDPHVTEDVMKVLSTANHNGTVIPSLSLKHFLDDASEIPYFFNLHTIEAKNYARNTTILLLVESDQLDEVKGIIREVTENFSLSHGGMATLPLEDFEGSF